MFRKVGGFLRVLQFPPPVKLIFHHHHHRLDVTLAVAEAKSPNKTIKPQTKCSTNSAIWYNAVVSSSWTIALVAGISPSRPRAKDLLNFGIATTVENTWFLSLSAMTLSLFIKRCLAFNLGAIHLHSHVGFMFKSATLISHIFWQIFPAVGRSVTLRGHFGEIYKRGE